MLSYLSAIVHDLKNPLIVILAFSRRIKEGKLSVDIALQPIIDSAENMQKTVDSTLDFARPFQLEFRKEDIRDVVQRACRSCRAKAEEREVTLSIDVPADPIYMEIDAPNLARALTNVIHNSVDASSNGQNVIISTARKKDHVEARIKDVGSGMDKETLENIFVPFFSNKKAGTGLGMPIVKKIVEGHQGRIRILSQPGRGTEVFIALPFSPSPETDGKKRP